MAIKNNTPSVDYREALIERLRSDEKEQYYYLKAALEDNSEDSPEALLLSLKTIAEARGFASFAKDTGLSRESLYRTLSKNGNPKLDTIFKIFGALGMRLTIEPLEKKPKKKASEATFFANNNFYSTS